MELTDAQKDAVDKAVESVMRAENFVIAGYAGVGKTVVAGVLFDRLKENGFTVAVVAPTGKAAHNLNKKYPHLEATTMHKLLTRNPRTIADQLKKQLRALLELNDTDFKQERVEQMEEIKKKIESLLNRKDSNDMRFDRITEKPCDVVIFDEASMIDDEFWRDFVNPFDFTCVFFGDPAQLPPVGRNGKPVRCVVTLHEPDIMFTEVHRQAAGSGILSLATDIRNDIRINLASYNQVDIKFIDCDPNLPDDILKEYAGYQFVVDKNDRRNSINRRVRTHLGYGLKDDLMMTPDIGETIMIDSNKNEFMKGQLLKVLAVTPRVDNQLLVDCTGMIEGTDAPVEFVMRLDGLMTWETLQTPLYKNARRMLMDRDGINVIWPYAITCHKAQGSEYENVLVTGDWMGNYGDDKEFRKWIYTAVTRAKSHLVLNVPRWNPPKQKKVVGKDAVKAKLKAIRARKKLTAQA